MKLFKTVAGMAMGATASMPALASVVLSPLLTTPAQLSNPIMNQTTYVTGNTHLPGDTRIFTLNKTGLITVTDRASNTTSVFKDLTATTASPVEHGLLGLTFDPGYASNGWYYVMMHSQPTSGGPIYGQVMRFTDPAIATGDPLSIFRYDTQGTMFHQAGWIDFARDGSLLIAVGDGSHYSGPDLNRTGQNPADLFGSILRINPYNDAFAADPVQNYAIPAGNLVDTNASAAPEVFAYGVRNPFRNSVAPDGNLLIADVGQVTAEEVTILPLASAARNLGWSLREGNVATPGVGGPVPADYVGPAFAYSDLPGGSAIIGGYVYRGSLVPELYGRYVFGDQVSGNIWSIAYTGTDLVDGTLSLLGNLPSLVSFGETQTGELLATQYKTSAGTQVFQLSSTSPAVPEPSTWFLMIGGLGVIAGALRRRPLTRSSGAAFDQA